MSKAMTMLLLANRGKGEEAENKFRDRRGREHYDNGRYAPQSNWYGDYYGAMNKYNHDEEMEGRNEARSNYRNNESRGMYSAYSDMGNNRSETRNRLENEMRRGARNEMDSGMENDMRYGMDNEMRRGSQNKMRRGMQNEMRMGEQNEMRGYRTENNYGVGMRSNRSRYNEPRQIGFNMGGEVETNYRSEAAYNTMDEMKHQSEEMQGGHASSKSMKMTKQAGEEWVQNMKNADGSMGAHWTKEQAKQLMTQKGIKCDPEEFWIALNAMYSDYCGVAKKLGINSVEFYAYMAKAFLEDEDAVEDKLGAYYYCVVEHE